MIDTFDSKKGNTQGGKKEPLKKENSEKNGADFISIVDRMLPDPHGGNTYGKKDGRLEENA